MRLIVAFFAAIVHGFCIGSSWRNLWRHDDVPFGLHEDAALGTLSVRIQCRTCGAYRPWTVPIWKRKDLSRWP